MLEILAGGSVALAPGDCLATLRAMAECSVDAVVTDPPYGLAFMGKAWDGTDNTAFQVAFWTEVLRVLKPGGHVAAFSGTRTYHRLAVAIEDAGFEIRDQLAWTYGTGFPKSMDVSKAIDKAAGAQTYAALGEFNQSQTLPVTAPASPESAEWEGWGTALKPAWEPIALARKPLDGTVAANVLAYRTGGLNIDGCRVGTSRPPSTGGADKFRKWKETDGVKRADSDRPDHRTDVGRFPANLIHDGSPEVEAAFGPSSRFFYCAKASAAERLGSAHPTVKPLAVMEWLIRLVTPPGGLLLDPFAGTGSTGEAAARQGFKAMLCEREPQHCDDIRVRMGAMALSAAERRTLGASRRQQANSVPSKIQEVSP